MSVAFADKSRNSLRLTAHDLSAEKIIDRIVHASPGDAHTDYRPGRTPARCRTHERLAEAVGCSQDERLARRYNKLRDFGRWGTTS
jgi:acetyl-CoA carboxylase alpha subunit